MADEVQDFYVQVGAAFFSFTGMTQDAVDALLPSFGVGGVFIDKPTYDAALAAQAEARAQALALSAGA